MSDIRFICGYTVALAAHGGESAAYILPVVVSFISYDAVQYGKVPLKPIFVVYFEPI